MPRIMVWSLILIFCVLSIGASTLNQIQYMAYVKSKNDSRLALLKIKQDYVYVVQGDTLFDYVNVVEVTDRHVVLYDTKEKESVTLSFEKGEDKDAASGALVTRPKPASTPRPGRARTLTANELEQNIGQLYLEPGNFNINWSNARSTLILMAKDFTDLHSVSVVINYDASLIEIQQVTEGYLLRQNKGATEFNHEVEAGAIALDITRLEDKGVNGKGMVASFTFKPKENGTTEFEITTAQAFDSAYTSLELSTTGSVVNVNVPETEEDGDVRRENEFERAIREREIRKSLVPEEKLNRDKRERKPDERE